MLIQEKSEAGAEMNQNDTKRYKRITCFYRQKLEEKVFQEIQKKYQWKHSSIEKAGDHLYHVKVQNLEFYCSYSDDELQHIISTCTDLLEIMKQRVNAGETKEHLEDVQKRIKERDKNASPEQREFFDQNGYAREISSDECETLIYLLGVYTRVGGAYAMFLAYPRMRQADAAVLESCMDRFDDEEVYYAALYFLTRAAMGMHEIKLDDPESEEKAS